MGFNIHILSGRNRSTNLARHAAQAASFNPCRFYRLGNRSSADELEHWMTAPQSEALKLQRPLPDDALRIVARGRRQVGSAEP
jgi:hypothetical protein